MTNGNSENQDTSSFSSALKREVLYLIFVLMAIVVIIKIAFYKEGISIVIRTAFGIFWLFILPGVSILYYWHEKMAFIERLIIGIVLSSALIGISSYYLGLLGLHIKYHAVVIPLALLICGGFIIFFKLKNNQISG